MAEFPEPVFAVRAAMAIQQRLSEQNQSVTENERLHIRTGINCGAGFRKGNDLFGDAVNLAARITKKSGTGQILISNIVREALADTGICCKSVGKVVLDGKAETEELYEVVWAGASLSDSNKIASARSYVPSLALGLLAAAAILIVGAMAWLDGGVDNPPQADTTPSAAEFAAFRMAESLNTEESWNAFLSDYKESELADAALKSLQKLQTREAERAVAEQSVAADTAKKNVAAITASSSAPALARRAKFVDTVRINGGVFMMGNDQGKSDERPRHQVRLDGFHISASPITNRQYFSFLEDTGHPRPRDPEFAKNYLLGSPDQPVVNVSYDDAVSFCKWASKKFGIPVRLPTEAEWEYAAVNQQTASIAEWVSDYYSKDYYTISPVKNPKGPATGSKRVIRGPSIKGSSAVSFRRSDQDPKDSDDHISFRVVVDSGVN
jgi:formylglycine-generating enzyme required for sulfatase activity